MWGNVLVATRLEKMVESQFVFAWSHLIAKGLRKGDQFAIAKDRVAHQAANELVRVLLRSNCDSIFFIDSDADVGPGFLEELRSLPEGSDYDALQAFYTRRGWPPEAIWFKKSALGDLMQCLVWKDNHTEEVALVGLHSVLIRRGVFETMLAHRPNGIAKEDFEWFYYPKHEHQSEDSAFSIDATKHGFRLGATTEVKAGHISRVTTGWETYQQFNELTGINRKWEEYFDLVSLVAEYTKTDTETVIANALRGNKNVKYKWMAHNPQTAGEVRAFYNYAGENYIYDLLAWNVSPTYLNITEPLKDIHNQRVLVVGSGIGGEVNLLHERNQVVAYDISKPLREFIDFRFDGHVPTISDLDEYKGKFDFIVMIDVLEHIHPTDFEKFMNKLAAMLDTNGRFFIHATWDDQDGKYPMHFDNSKEFEDWRKQHEAKSN